MRVPADGSYGLQLKQADFMRKTAKLVACQVEFDEGVQTVERPME